MAAQNEGSAQTGRLGRQDVVVPVITHVEDLLRAARRHLDDPGEEPVIGLGGPVAWHAFAITTFDLGRDDLDVGPGLQIGVYDAERTLVDTFRMRHRQGDDEAYEALRRWLRRRESQPSTLLTMAGHFPRSVAPIRQALTVLL